ncbi:cytosolic sulfotransferase 15-like [Rutidosis leptorrhynchoides]|uniref:cytosolic sulfotransferase 15-like n=1 Tax=Rutidosis leptorrhynchoides TaxID=125765 RepID=UPI003A997E3E
MWTREHFKAKPSDIFLITIPKCGTTWLKALVFSIVNRTRFDFSSHPLLTHNPHDLVPFLEHKLFRSPPIGDPEILPSPRILASHIPYNLLPQSIIEDSLGSCKIVHICRDPKDVFVSLWHFANSFRHDGFSPMSLEEGFDLFCKGISFFGPIWDNTLGYWKASLESPNKVLFLKYEDMKENTFFHVKKLANFLDRPFTHEEEENGVIQEIIKLCSFETISNLEVNKTGIHRNQIKNSVFFRKGVTGDWKNYLTLEMADQIDSIVEQRLKGTGLTFKEPSY